MYKLFLAHFLMLLCVCRPALLGADSGDTLLNMVVTKPYFYNLIKGINGKIFAGTAEGIMEIEGVHLKTISDVRGYITADRNGRPVIDSTGIRYYKEKKYVHLLPYPDLSREEYHASSKNQFYVASGGQLYIFDIAKYEISYPFHSVRSISKNLVGTYSGVYFKGKKLDKPAPSFTEGYIREFGNRAFICSYAISVLDIPEISPDATLNKGNFFSYEIPGAGLINDILPTPKGNMYFVAAEYKLLLIDHLFSKDSVLFTHQTKDSPINLIDGDSLCLYFTAGNQILNLEYKSGKITPSVTLQDNILGGIFYEHQLFLLTKNALYRFNSGQELEQMISLEKAHTLEMLSGSELIISTDQGLYLFNIASKSLSVIIKGVEFNRKALFRDENTVYAGSINGLYKIRIQDIPILIEENLSNLKTDQKWLNTAFIATISTIIILCMGIFIFLYRKKLIAAEETIEYLRIPPGLETPVSREAIEEHIRNNLSTASINMLRDKFKMSAPQLYVVLNPEKPGALIQRLRLDTFREMLSGGSTYKEISEATGLSISYLKRIKISE